MFGKMDAWIVIVLLGAVVIVYAWLLPKPQERKTVDEEVLNTVEHTLSSFVEELEQENKQFVKLVGDMKKDHEGKTLALMDRIEFLEQKTAKLSEQLVTSVPASSPINVHLTSNAAPSKSVERTTVKSRYQEVFGLYDQGKSIEYIAKKLGTNKGEVQLIIQLAKREEQADAAK